MTPNFATSSPRCDVLSAPDCVQSLLVDAAGFAQAIACEDFVPKLNAHTARCIVCDGEIFEADPHENRVEDEKTHDDAPSAAMLRRVSSIERGPRRWLM
jgi:hypothetical protein